MKIDICPEFHLYYSPQNRPFLRQIDGGLIVLFSANYVVVLQDETKFLQSVRFEKTQHPIMTSFYWN